MSNPARRPQLNEHVHYVSYGTPGGEYKPQCRAADVTEINPDGTVGLMVKNPTGLFFDRHIPYSSDRRGGSFHWEH